MNTKPVKKAGRLLLLYRLREAGVITDDLTLQEIGDALGVNRSTILRDFRVLDRVKAEYNRLMALQPWQKAELTTQEFANAIGASAETVRAMVRDGLIEARKDHTGLGAGLYGRWMIPYHEVERFKEE